jgi:predicted nucleic acid-binding Zn finger protein
MVCGHGRTKKKWPPIHLITDHYPNQEIVNTKRINTLVEEGAVKFHIFQPSGRAIWTVVGRDDEHWGDIELGFCSCKSYYYKTLSNGKPCYHLLCIELAKKHNKFVTIRFHDTEYTQFIKALLSDFTCKSLT